MYNAEHTVKLHNYKERKNKLWIQLKLLLYSTESDCQTCSLLKNTIENGMVIMGLVWVLMETIMVSTGM